MNDKMTPENYVKTVKSAVSEFFSAMGTAEDVKALVKKQLEEKRREIFAKVLGFDNRWGKWELDHCNGRRSTVSDTLADVVEGAGAEWVQDCIKRYTKKGSGILGMTQAQEKALIEGYQAKLKRDIERIMYDKASQHASELASKMAEQATAELTAQVLDIEALNELPGAL